MQELVTKSDVYLAKVQSEGIILDLSGDTCYGIDGIGTMMWKIASQFGQKTWRKPKSGFRRNLAFLRQKLTMR